MGNATAADQAVLDQYGAFALAAVAGLIGLGVLVVALLVAYRRYQYRQTLPGKCRWHFFVAYSEEEESSEIKVDQMREWLRIAGFKAWGDVMAGADGRTEGVELSVVFVLFLSNCTFQSAELVRLLEKAVAADKPIVLVADDERFDKEDAALLDGCSDNVRSHIVPKLMACVEPISFSYKSESALRNMNVTARALEAAFKDRKKFVFSRLSESKPKVRAIVPALLQDEEI